MSKLEIDYKNQLEDNIKSHNAMFNLTPDVIDVIQNIKKIKKRWKIAFLWKWRFCC